MISDNQRRFVCRILFLLICAAPTSTVGYWMLHPQTATQWEREIQTQLGIAAHIDSIETPGPYVTILRGFKLTDPELGNVFQSTEIRLEFGKTNRVTIPQTVRMNSAGVVHLVRTINEHLLRAHAADRPWQIRFLNSAIIEESLVAGSPNQMFPETVVAANLSIDVQPILDGTISKLQFQLPLLDEKTWVAGALSRSRADLTGRSQQRLELNTNELELPVWLLGDLVPEIQSLGTSCRFAGRIDLNPSAGNPYGWFAGKFSGISPAAVTGHHSPDSGETYAARIDLCKLNGNVEHLDAFLIRPDGTASPIEETLTVVEQFDVPRALRSADQSSSRLRAETLYR